MVQVVPGCVLFSTKAQLVWFLPGPWHNPRLLELVKPSPGSLACILTPTGTFLSKTCWDVIEEKGNVVWYTQHSLEPLPPGHHSGDFLWPAPPPEISSILTSLRGWLEHWGPLETTLWLKVAGVDAESHRRERDKSGLSLPWHYFYCPAVTVSSLHRS